MPGRFGGRRSARDPRLARHAGLAESATGGRDPVFFSHFPDHRPVAIVPAQPLVVSVAADCPDRAAADAGPAASITTEEAVFTMVEIASRGGDKNQIGDDAAAAMGNTPLGDETP